jgi:type I restriction enzyme, S subunit
MNNGLPQGWAEIELQECVDVLDNERVPVNSDERAKRQGDVPYYGATGQVGWIDETLFNEELLLIGEDGAPFFDKSKPISYIIRGKSWVNNHAHVLRARPNVSSNQYLKHFLDSFDFHEFVNGTTRLKLTQGAMNRIPVRLAPLGEQWRMVAKLEKLLGKVDACQERLATIPLLLKRFRQSVLAAACSGELTKDWREENPQKSSWPPAATGKRPLPAIAEDELLFDAPKSWKWCRLGSLALFVNGDRGKNYPNKSEYVPTGVPFINAGHIQANGTLCSESMHHIAREKYDSLRSGKIQTGDLLYCLRGTLGKTAIVESYSEGAIASSLVIVRMHEAMHRRFAYYYLTSRFGMELVERFDNGSAQPNLSADSVKHYVIPLPPLAEQQEIVRRVEALFALADQIEGRYAKAKAYVEKLTPSLLARAFRGELVPQDPKDEPASVLLEGIRSAVTSAKAHSARPARYKL